MTPAQLKAITENFHGKQMTVYCKGHTQAWGIIEGVGLGDGIGPDGKDTDQDYLLLRYPNTSIQTWVGIEDIWSFEIEMVPA